MKIHNVLDTKPKKSAMDLWMDNFFTTTGKKKKKTLPKQDKIFFGTDYGPDDARYKK